MKMNKKMLSGMAGIAAMVAFAAPAQALIIDLNLTSQNGYAGPAYTQDGYTLTNTGSSTPANAYGNWLTLGAPQFNANGTNATLFQNYGNTTNALTKVGGGSFNFQSIALADVYNNGGGYAVNFVFNYVGGGSSTQSVTLDTLPGLQTFTFNQTNLSSVAFTTVGGNYLQFDFINVTGAGAVPETATWGMMILGFGMVGAAARRRKTKTTVSFA